MKEYLKQADKKTILFWLAAGVAVLVLVIVESKPNDFDLFLSASSDFIHGDNMYVILYNQWYHYYYSVLFAILLLPFTVLSFFWAHCLWILLNVFFVVRTFHVLWKQLNPSFNSGSRKTIFTLLVFLWMIRFLRDNFHHGQVTMMILYLTVEGLHFVFNRKPILGAAFISLGINIKLLPIVILPYLIYRKQFTASGFILVFWLFYLFLPSIVIGHHQNIFLMNEWWRLINPSNSEHLIDTAERSFHSLTTLIPTLLMKNVPDKFALPVARNIADLQPEKVIFILNVIRLFFVLLTFYFLRTLPFRKSRSRRHSFWELSYLFLVIPLLFPHQQHYAFYFCLPAVLYLLHYFLVIHDLGDQKKIKMKIGRAIFVLVVVLFNASVLLGVFNAYYDHFKIITYGALLMVLLLIVYKPEDLEIVKGKRISDS